MKITKTLGIMLSTMVINTAIVVAAVNETSFIKVSSSEVSYSLNFGNGNNMSSGSTYDAITSGGNPIEMNYSSASLEDNEFINLSGVSGTFLSNNVAVSGIKTISITVDQNYDIYHLFHVYGAHTLDNLNKEKYTSEAIATFNSSTTYTYNFEGTSPSFFALAKDASLSEQSIKILSVNVEYACLPTSYYRVDILGDYISECGSITASYTGFTKTFTSTGYFAVPANTSVKFTADLLDDVTFVFWQAKIGTSTSNNANKSFSLAIKNDSSVYLNAYPNSVENKFVGFSMWQGVGADGSVYYTTNKTLQRVGLLEPVLVLPGDSIVFDNKSGKYKMGYFLKPTDTLGYEKYYVDSGWKTASNNYAVPNTSTVSGVTYNFDYSYLVLNLSYSNNKNIDFADYGEISSCINISRAFPEQYYELKNVTFTGYNDANLKNKVVYGNDYVATLDSHIEASQITITSNGNTLVLGTDYTFVDHVLTVNSLTSDINISIDNNISVNYERFENIDGCITNSSSASVVGTIPSDNVSIYMNGVKLTRNSDYTISDENELTINNPTGDIVVANNTFDFKRGYYYSTSGATCVRTSSTKRASTSVPIKVAEDEVVRITGLDRQYQFDFTFVKPTEFNDTAYIQTSYYATDITKEFTFTRDTLKKYSGNNENFLIYVNFLKKVDGTIVELTDSEIPLAQQYITISKA